MSNLLETVDVNETPACKKFCYSLSKNKHKRILKSKENVFKPKCNRELKKKLKKYKLRRDGIEDPDILNVSEILVRSLRIKSPNGQDKIYCNNNKLESKELNPENYLIRMVRRKKTGIDVESLGSIKSIVKDQNEESILSTLMDEAVDKKHMDAFKLMMEARNKSIGSNSPGKEKIQELEPKDIVERKESKAKRILTLQKMALSKGSLENKEIEEFRDECVEKKMTKRAERFKEMITKTDHKVEKKVNKSQGKHITQDIQKQLPYNNDLIIKAVKNETYKLCDLFNEKIETIDSKQPRKVAKEDIDFLKKLSPSIKKKENMLSYFRKISKDDSDELESTCTLEKESLIKTKLNKKCIKKALPFSSEDLQTAKITQNKVVVMSKSSEPHINSYKRCKRKRNTNVEERLTHVETNGEIKSPNMESRPKRNAKKPLKYAEDIQMITSDEEFHIFTPKKKKRDEKCLKSKDADTRIQEVENVVVEKKKKNKIKAKDAVLCNEDQSKSKIKSKKKSVSNYAKDVNSHSVKPLKPNNKTRAVKMAPIFVAKMQMSLADIEAKHQFLKSGVPEKLKKKVQVPTKVVTYDNFPTVVHIQQNKPIISLHQEKDWFHVSDTDELSCSQNEHAFKTLLLSEEAFDFDVPIVNRHKPGIILNSIKCAYPKFPVYRTYHLLRGKSKGEFKDCSYPDLDNSIEIINEHCVEIHNESPDQLNWCDKYKPTSSKQIIGNYECIKELKRWLEAWTDNLFKTKQNVNDDSDYSDFYHSDNDSRDTIKTSNNLLILSGKTGSGKTSSVYAVASELGIKVIEVNVSSKRTGKIMLQDLQEATQSHKVDRCKSGSENSQKLHEEIVSTKIKNHGRPKKVYKHSTKASSKVQKSCEISNAQLQLVMSQESVRTGMSLILIDDADIVFEQDDGFCSAISQLIQCSKRPVILITSSMSCPHLQRFQQNGKVLQMYPVLSRMLGTWLDVMCLADVGKCYTGLGSKMLEFYNGDVRKSINCLQFYMNWDKRVDQDDEVALSQIKHNIDDEDSSMSWINSESLETPMSNHVETQCYIDSQLQVLNFGTSLNVFNFWWSLPSHYKDYNYTNGDTNILDKLQSTTEINGIADVLDAISMIDFLERLNQNTGPNITRRPWHRSESSSLLENENFQLYDKSSLVTKQISDTLIKSTNVAAQKVLKHGKMLNFQPPSMSRQRIKDRIVSQHNNLSDYLNPSAVLDRRATALDYWPACRAICRIERGKSDLNTKRKNRFCHYLKSLNIPGKNDYYDSLANSLS